MSSTDSDDSDYTDFDEISADEMRAMNQDRVNALVADPQIQRRLLTLLSNETVFLSCFAREDGSIGTAVLPLFPMPHLWGFLLADTARYIARAFVSQWEEVVIEAVDPVSGERRPATEMEILSIIRDAIDKVLDGEPDDLEVVDGDEIQAQHAAKRAAGES